MAVESPKRPRTRVTLVQLVTALLVFVVLSVMGGFLVAGLALPAVTAASNAVEESSKLFEELPTAVSQTTLPQQSNIYDRTGTHLLATFYNQNRVVVPLEQISPWIQKAVVAIEDKRFWDHQGVDGQGLVRAAYVNLTSSESPGGSTLTQQLIKNILLQNAIAKDDYADQKAATEVTITRKIREWRLALAYEERADAQFGTHCTDTPEVDCGKEQVLEQYLNIAQFGTNVYGVETAAQLYFGKPAAQLDAIEAATIAGITQNPSKWDPLRYPANAQKRRNTVLYVMYQQGMITHAEYNIDRATPIASSLDPHRPKVSCAAAAEAPFFCDYVTKVITLDPVFNQGDESGFDLLQTGGLTIITTLDVSKQKIANQELAKSMPSTDKSGWAMALIALDPTTGEILTMAQNRAFSTDPAEKGATAINYTVDRKWGGSRGFSPGSTFKPVVLAEWLASGRALMQTVSSAQRSYDSSSWIVPCAPYNDPKPWRPANAEGHGGGQMSVLRATEDSVNTAYAAMANQLDLCEIKAMAATLGFERADGADFEALPASVLGTQNASPLTMASVSQTFANGGVHCDPIAILSITDPQGNHVDVPPKTCKQVISRDISNGVTLAMEDVIESGTGVVAQLAGKRPAAGKTGTSQLSSHLWFMGFTPQLVATVWMGNPTHDVPGRDITINGKSYRGFIYGSTISAPTWKRFMDRALKGADVLTFEEPSNDVLYGIPRDIPNVVGRREATAKALLNAAGFSYNAATVYNPSVPVGTVAAQDPPAGTSTRPGARVTYYVSTSDFPAWWTNWPSDWDPNVPPADYWGDTWPPPEWLTNPPVGWNPTPVPTVTPSPVPGPSKGKGGGG